MTKGGRRFPSAVADKITVQWLDSIPGCLTQDFIKIRKTIKTIINNQKDNTSLTVTRMRPENTGALFRLVVNCREVETELIHGADLQQNHRLAQIELLCKTLAYKDFILCRKNFGEKITI